MSSARTYDTALPLPSVLVAKMKSVNDCLNMTGKVYQIDRMNESADEKFAESTAGEVPMPAIRIVRLADFIRSPPNGRPCLDRRGGSIRSSST